MGVYPYEWSNRVGGQDPSGGGSGGGASADSLSGEPESFSGSLAAGNTTINFTRSTKWVHIYNTDDTDTLEFSVDGGTNWVPIVSYGDLNLNIAVTSLLLRPLGGAVNVDYEITAGLTSS
jgi:hypothetical protein